MYNEIGIFVYKVLYLCLNIGLYDYYIDDSGDDDDHNENDFWCSIVDCHMPGAAKLCPGACPAGK